MAIIHDALAAGKGEQVVQGAKQEEENPYMKDIKQMTAAKIFAQSVGGTINDKDHLEGLPIKIIQTAMDNNAALVKQANDNADKKDKMAETLREKADQSQLGLYSLMFEEMRKTAGELRAVVEKVNENKPPPRGAVETIKEAKELISLVGNEMFGGRNTAPPAESNESLTLKKQEMMWGHDERITKMNMELEKMRYDLQFKLAELADNKELKKQEREDSKSSRQTAIDAVTDIAAAAKAAFEAKTGEGVGAQVDKPSAGQKEQGKPDILAQITSFPCQGCGEEIAMPSTGDEVICPSCGVHYGLKRAVKSSGQ